jgi:tetratricopeptide (TPR) repeat protein
MRIDPRFQAQVTRIDGIPVSLPPAPLPPTPDPVVRGDVAELTRGEPGTMRFARLKKSRPARPSPQTPPRKPARDTLDRSEPWRRRLGEVVNDPMLVPAALRDGQTSAPLAAPPPDTPTLGDTVEDWIDRILAFALGPVAVDRRRSERQGQDLAQARTLPRDEAIALLRRTVQRDPDAHEARRGLGRLLLQAGSHAEAEAHFQTLLARDPRDYALQVGLGEIYYHLGEPVLARQAFLQAATLRSRHSDPPAWLGILAYESGDLREASRFLDRAIQLDPGHVVARHFQGQVALQMNDPLRASFQFDMVARLEPGLGRPDATTRPLLPASGTGPTPPSTTRWRSPRRPD